jgi:replicative DNA helicase
LEVPVLALSQLSRSNDLEPSLHDLRDSGSLEEDADIVFFIVRPEMIKKDDPTLKGQAELRLDKQRNGSTGLVRLHFLEKCASFVPAPNIEYYEDL